MMTETRTFRRPLHLVVLVAVLACHDVTFQPSCAFAFSSSSTTFPSYSKTGNTRWVLLGAERIDSDGKASLPPSSSSSNNLEELSVENIVMGTSSSSSVSVMMTRETKRILIEELGYSRKDCDSMRVELAAPIVEKGIQCPDGGMPQSWIDDSRRLASQLESESQYPLKVPLLGVSLVLFGKGFGDALITLIKVKQNFPGASLTAEFFGVNVLAIDLACVAVGLGLGLWTFRTMRDN